MNRSARRSPMALKTIKSPFASLRDEQVGRQHRRGKAPERSKAVSSPKSKKRSGRLLPLQSFSLSPRREQFSRLDSTQSLNTCVNVSEPQQEPEESKDKVQKLKPKKTLEEFIKHSRQHQMHRQMSAPADFYSPSSYSTITVKQDKKGLPLLPFSEDEGTKKEDVIFVKDPSLSRKQSSRTQAVFAQLRFEDGSTRVDYVRLPLISSSSEGAKTAKMDFKVVPQSPKKSDSTVVPQLYIPSSSTSGVRSLEDLDVEYVRVPLVSSAA